MTVVVVVLVVVSTVLRRRIVRRSEARSRRTVDRLPDALDMLTAGLRAGLDINTALRLVADHGPPDVADTFADVVHEIDEGARFTDAVLRFHGCLGGASEAFIATLTDAHRLGVPIETLVDRLALDARLSRRRANERSVRELPVQLTLPLVTCILPSFVLVVIVPTVVGTLASLDVSF